MWASWPRPEQQNTGPLAWPQRNTSLLIQPRAAKETKSKREREVCSASPAVFRYLVTVYTRRRSGFTAEHSWDEKAGHRVRAALCGQGSL